MYAVLPKSFSTSLRFLTIKNVLSFFRKSHFLRLTILLFFVWTGPSHNVLESTPNFGMFFLPDKPTQNKSSASFLCVQMSPWICGIAMRWSEFPERENSVCRILCFLAGIYSLLNSTNCSGEFLQFSSSFIAERLSQMCIIQTALVSEKFSFTRHQFEKEPIHAVRAA